MAGLTKTCRNRRKQVAKTRGDIFNPLPGASGTFVCSNHFPLGRTPENSKTDYLLCFMYRATTTLYLIQFFIRFFAVGTLVQVTYYNVQENL